jgi:hypothetical protein
MKAWYYVIDNEKNGPAPEEELVHMFQSGKLSPDTLVWSEGMEEWTAANSVESLSRAAFGRSPKSKNGEVAPVKTAAGSKSGVKPAHPAPIKMDKPSFDAGKLHFSCSDRTDTSWFFNFGYSPVPRMLHSKGAAVLHYPCRGYHKVRINMSSTPSAYDEVFPKEESDRERFFEELLRAFGIPENTPWTASWRYGGEYAFSSSGPDPDVRIRY